MSTEFLAAVTGSHTMVARAVLIDDVPQFSTAPAGTPIPHLAGDVTLTSRTDVKSTLSLTVPGEWWDRVQPYGAEIYVQRGIRLASGTIEYADLGYHRIEQASQDDAPNGPVQLTCLDRIAQLQQNRLVFPLPVDEGITHRAVFERLINGGSEFVTLAPTLPTNGAYPVPISIIWDAYDPDEITIFADQVVADDSYAFLAQLATERNATLRFDGAGRLVIAPTVVNAAVAVARLAGGASGTRIKVSRTASRRGVYNIVTAYGSDPANATGFVVAFNSDPASPIRWNGPFGAAPRYLDSPLFQDDAAVEAGSSRLLDRYTGLPVPLEIECVPNPALMPDDVIDVPIGSSIVRCVIDSHVIPLVANQVGKITTRMLNDSEGVSSDLGT